MSKKVKMYAKVTMLAVVTNVSLLSGCGLGKNSIDEKDKSLNYYPNVVDVKALTDILDDGTIINEKYTIIKTDERNLVNGYAPYGYTIDGDKCYKKVAIKSRKIDINNKDDNDKFFRINITPKGR